MLQVLSYVTLINYVLYYIVLYVASIVLRYTHFVIMYCIILHHISNLTKQTFQFLEHKCAKPSKLKYNYDNYAQQLNGIPRDQS